MNVPAIAYQTFMELKDRAETMEFVQFVLKKLEKLHEDSKRARYVHRLVDELSQPMFESAIVKSLSPCSNGCSACCHTQVSITADEAELLAEHVNNNIKINLDALVVQMEAKNSSEAWYALSFQERRCIFLNDKNACMVYEDRPSVCRTNAVLRDAEQCDTRVEIKPTRLVKTPEADLAVYASFLHSKDSGALPYMLAKSLKIDVA